MTVTNLHRDLGVNVDVVCRSVEASAMCRSLVQENLAECVHIIECGQARH